MQGACSPVRRTNKDSQPSYRVACAGEREESPGGSGRHLPASVRGIQMQWEEGLPVKDDQSAPHGEFPFLSWDWRVRTDYNQWL